MFSVGDLGGIHCDSVIITYLGAEVPCHQILPHFPQHFYEAPLLGGAVTPRSPLQFYLHPPVS